MPNLITTLGPKSADEMGMILPHEHVFVDLRTWDVPGYAEADADEVIRLMEPEVSAAKEAGISAIVEPSTVGVGRRADILRAVSEATGFPLVAPTGVYREPWVPDRFHAATEEELRDWMIGELTSGIEDTGVRAGWIKLSAGDDGITKCEMKVLRAASAAGSATNSTIGSHTIRGHVVMDQLDIIESAGYTPERFVWIHAQQEPDFGLHREAARRGAWIEYDGIGGGEDDRHAELVLKALESGFGDRVLLSQDRGWYDPAKPGGGTPCPYTHITESFLPRLKAFGVDDATISELTRANPFRAFAREDGTA